MFFTSSSWAQGEGLMLEEAAPARSALRCPFQAQSCSEAPGSLCSEAPTDTAAARQGRAFLGKVTLCCAPPCCLAWPVHSPALHPGRFFQPAPALTSSVFETPGPLPNPLPPPPGHSHLLALPQNMPSVVSVNSLLASVPWPLDSCCSRQPAPASPTARPRPGLGPGLGFHPA